MGHGSYQLKLMIWGVVILATPGCSGEGYPGRVAEAAQSPPVVQPGVEVLLTDSLHLVAGKRVGLVTNLAAVDSRGVSTVEHLRAGGVNLVALFGPEHGLAATAAPGEKVASGVDSATAIPIYSLYGATVRPTAAMLDGLDLLLVDLPDVGARYYTYLGTTVEVMIAAAEQEIPVVILDRPNPIGGAIQGNILDTAFASLVGRLAVPMRHGLTLGEQARLARDDLSIDVSLAVVPVRGWTREMEFEETGLPFRAPSPNLKDVDALFHYPGTVLFEGTALSVGRGTDFPFHQVGAPWLDTTAVLARIMTAGLPGVTFEGVGFTPRNPGDAKFADQPLAGIRLRITDRKSYDPTVTAIHLLAAIRAIHPDLIAIGGSFDRLAGGRTIRERLLRGDPAGAITADWAAGIERYRQRVKPFLIYD
ncbi:MAG: DUF1343 domain-containing protein [Gemmatimonadales bacterium]|nr:DUF1343 domain-containing protein [Gemmatimonadales bacterium]MDZ4389893.1 DUF1343 domain-containing protein [Gemmatimonadales bacterium]